VEDNVILPAGFEILRKGNRKISYIRKGFVALSSVANPTAIESEMVA
jgi:hypothetical protein